jgi:hypothetical protein
MINHVENGAEIPLFCRDAYRDSFTYVGPMSLERGQRFANRPSRFVFQLAPVIKERAA